MWPLLALGSFPLVMIVAVAAPVIMIVDPGPMEDEQASVASRHVALAKPHAVCTMACSLRGW